MDTKSNLNEQKEISSIYSMSFHSFELNDGKYNLIKAKAEAILSFKQSLSLFIHQNFDKCKEMSGFDMVTQFNQLVHNLVCQDVQNAISDVYTSYYNKFYQVKNKLKFTIYDKSIIEYYKINGRDFKKGDIKSKEIKMKSTPLTKTMSYLAKYGDENTREYITNKILLEENNDKKTFFQTVLFYMTKFGDKRLLNLASAKHNRLNAQYNKQPINFKSLSFRTTIQASHDIIGWNKNRKSVIPNFISLGGYVKPNDEVYKEPVFSFEERKKTINDNGKINRAKGQKTKLLCIPTKYARSFHGDMKDYNKKKPSYIICFEPNNVVRVILTKEGVRDVWVGGEEYMGVDVNVKHNLYYTSMDKPFDYDRDLFNNFVSFLKHIDEKKTTKSKDKTLTKEQKSSLSKADQKHMDRFHLKLENDLKEKTRALIDHAIANGKNHIIMEDLEAFGKMFSRSEQYEGFSYGRLCKLLNLSSLKHIVRSIAYKHGVSVTFAHAEYSSQQCNKCKCIDRANRKTQEIFHCVSCGYECNADKNSSDNLEDRLSEDVLRTQLFTKNDIGEFIPKKLSKVSLKGTLTLCPHGFNNK